MESSTDIQAQIDELKKKKKEALAKEAEKKERKIQAYGNKIDKFISSNIQVSIVKDYYEDSYYDLRSELLREDSERRDTISDWEIEDIINEKLESLAGEVKVIKDYIEGLKDLKEDLLKEFKK